MKPICALLLVSVATLSLVQAQEPAEPAQISATIQKTVNAFTARMMEFQKEMAALPPEQRMMTARLLMPDATETVEELIALIKSSPENDSMPDALSAIMQLSRLCRRPVDTSPAYEAIVTHHLDNQKTGMACLMAAFDKANREKSDQLLHAVLTKSSSDILRGVAAFALAQGAPNESEKVSFLETAVSKMGDFRLPDQRPLKPLAEGELRSLQLLSIGKIAPEIEGENIEGAKFKLSDYREKVVLLSFFGHWCGPCRAMYPHERTLVERLKDKPFAIVGVNSDPKEKATEAIKEENLSWPIFWDGGSTDGPITTAWGIQSWPAIFLLDAKGVIRYKNVRGSELDKAIETLLAELE